MSGRYGAIIWGRVSTLEQKDAGNSIPAQFQNCERFCAELKIPVLHRLSVAHSAFDDYDECQEFLAMIDLAIRDQRVKWVVVDKANRFARAREVSVPYKARLRRHGIYLRSADPSEPFIDPRTVGGIWVDGTREIMSEAQSLAIREDTMRAMKHNVTVRDPESGCCYKNGGVAPYPWETYYRYLGIKNRNGYEIRKALWRLVPEHAAVIRWVVVDLKIKLRLSNPEICDELNGVGKVDRPAGLPPRPVPIPSPKGGPWSVSTINDYFREDRLLQLAGFGWWNRHDPFTVGKKYKDRSEWIGPIPNAHPAVITEEEAQAARAAVQTWSRDPRIAHTQRSPWLLTGQNILQEDFFVCQVCGANVVSWSAGKNNHARYACGDVVYRHGVSCVPLVGINKQWLEHFLLKRIVQRYGPPRATARLVKRINEALRARSAAAAAVSEAEEKIRGELAEAEVKLAKLNAAIEAGVNPAAVAQNINAAYAEIERLKKLLKATAKAPKTVPQVSERSVRALLAQVTAAINQRDLQLQRWLIRAFIRRVEWNPKQRKLFVFWFDTPPIGPSEKQKPEPHNDGSGIDSSGDPNGLRLDSILSAETVVEEVPVEFTAIGSKVGRPPKHKTAEHIGRG